MLFSKPLFIYNQWAFKDVSSLIRILPTFSIRTDPDLRYNPCLFESQHFWIFNIIRHCTKFPVQIIHMNFYPEYLSLQKYCSFCSSHLPLSYFSSFITNQSVVQHSVFHRLRRGAMSYIHKTGVSASNSLSGTWAVLWLLPLSSHVASLRQGRLSHSLRSCSQRRPCKRGGSHEISLAQFREMHNNFMPFI